MTRLDAEPYGSCTEHRAQLRQYAEPCDRHAGGVVVDVACPFGCVLVAGRHDCDAR